jgi:hypothetical protein
MGVDAPNTPDRVVAPRVVPRPAEPFWEFRKNHVTYTCELRYHGEWGVEAQIFLDGDFRMSWRYQTRALAVAWAEAKRRDIRSRRIRRSPRPDRVPGAFGLSSDPVRCVRSAPSTTRVFGDPPTRQ